MNSTVSELREKLASLGLKKSGNKTELKNRLTEYEEKKNQPRRIACGQLIRTKPHPSLLGYTAINVCSSSTPFYRELSPMKLGPITAGGLTAQNLENLWQFSKVYEEEVDEKGDPLPIFFKRLQRGCDAEKGKRRKIKGTVLYTYWEDEKLTYLEARKRIYVPLYVKYVQQTGAWRALSNMPGSILINGYDGRPYKDLRKEYDRVDKPFGHELVLCAMLEGKLDLETGEWVD